MVPVCPAARADRFVSLATWLNWATWDKTEFLPFLEPLLHEVDDDCLAVEVFSRRCQVMPFQFLIAIYVNPGVDPSNAIQPLAKNVIRPWRKIVEALIDQGWRYDNSRGGHPMLYSLDRNFRPIPVPTTPGNPNLLTGFKAQVRRAGGRI